MTGFRSNPGTTVLPEDGKSALLSSSSAESCGDTNLATGFGPDDGGPRSFFSIGCGGGGFDALEDNVLKGTSSILSVGDDCPNVSSLANAEVSSAEIVWGPVPLYWKEGGCYKSAAVPPFIARSAR